METNSLKCDIFDLRPKHKPTTSCKDRRNRIMLFLALLKEKENMYNQRVLVDASVQYASIEDLDHILDELVALDF